MPRRRGGERILARSLGALVKEYQDAHEYKSLKPATKVVYDRAIAHLHWLYRVQLVDIRRRHAKKIRDELQDKPAIANQVVAVFSTLMAYAVDQEYVVANPVARVKKLKLGHHRRWTDEQIDFALRTLGEHYRRATVFGLYTGQRLSDCVAAPWTAFDGEGISFTQAKTDAPIWVPVHPDLRAEMQAWWAEAKAGGVVATTILSDARGKPFKPASFSANYSRELRKHTELRGCTFHGLRATLAAQIAEGEGTTKQIASMTGHKTLGMVEHYSQDADQRRLASAAILKLRGKGRT